MERFSFWFPLQMCHRPLRCMQKRLEPPRRLAFYSTTTSHPVKLHFWDTPLWNMILICKASHGQTHIQNIQFLIVVLCCSYHLTPFSNDNSGTTCTHVPPDHKCTLILSREMNSRHTTESIRQQNIILWIRTRQGCGIVRSVEVS